MRQRRPTWPDLKRHILISLSQLTRSSGSLPPRHLLVLMLHVREGLKTHEIAPLLNLSHGRTGAILAEAKQLFRRGLTNAEETKAPRRQKLVGG
jgi:DNA-directed RNA polymerase specialized sigma24 family protein